MSQIRPHKPEEQKRCTKYITKGGKLAYRPSPIGRCDCGRADGKYRSGGQYACDNCHAKYIAADKRLHHNNFSGVKEPCGRNLFADASDTILGMEPVSFGSKSHYPSNFSCNQPDRAESD